MRDEFSFPTPFNGFAHGIYTISLPHLTPPVVLLPRAIDAFLDWWSHHNISTCVLVEECMQMASRNNKVTFVNVRFSADDKLELKDFVVDPNHFTNGLVETLVEDLKLSISYNKDMDVYHASLAPRREDSKYSGKILMYRHGNPLKALIGIIFAHDVLYSGDWSKGLEDTSEDW